MVGGERRRHLRVPLSHPVLLRARTTRRAAQAKNVSAGGLLVSLREPVPVGSNVTVIMRPPGTPPAALRGVVVRVGKAGPESARRYEVGVKLLGEAGAAMTVLRRVGSPAARA